MRISFSFPLSSRIVAPKSMRNTDNVSRVSSLYSWGRTSTATTSTFKRAERMVRAIRSSSIKYLNTISYIGLAIFILFFLYALTDGKITKKTDSFQTNERVFSIISLELCYFCFHFLETENNRGHTNCVRISRSFPVKADHLHLRDIPNIWNNIKHLE